MRLYTLIGILIVPALGLVPGASVAAPNGAQLFARNCAVCHGADGNGGVGVPLALPSFQSSVPDSYLFKTIRHGRPGRVMPAFTQLSDAQIHAIVEYIRTFAPGKPRHLSDKPVKGDPQHGKQLFAEHCAKCHGARGQGGEGTGVTFSRPRNLPIMPPALNNPGFLGAATDQMIKATLMNGRKGTPMVSFLKQGLSEQDIDDLVAYIRSFQEHPLHPGQKDFKTIKPTIVYDSPYDLKTTVENVKRAAIGRNFKLIRVQYLDQGLVPAGKENTHRVIVYFCNFNFLNQALAIDPRVGLFLPCRVTVVEHHGKVKVYAINPERLSHLFNNYELNKLCDQMHDTYRDILEEATL
ncbi:MAG TPA: c-type cytochrome [Gammaproteobacteria bacterium]|nr:c-type cytochrome [Gammaproteobacteria bacterium]